MRSFTGFDRLSEASSHGWFITFFIVLRIAVGVQFFMAGASKIGDWSAEGYLLGSNGPFASFFQSLAGNALVDMLNVWGLMLIGIALIFGLMVRPASFFGVILMTLYYLAHFETNTANGYIDNHVILVIAFCLFLAGGSGHVFGVDGIVSRQIRTRRVLASLFFG